MKKFIIYTGIAIVIVICILLFYRSCSRNNIASYFSTDDEGWTVTGDAQGVSAKPVYQDSEGNPGGYISARDDVAGGVWYWSAPDKFLGNRSSSYGEKFTFELKQSSLENQFDADDLILVGKEMQLVFNTLQNPELTWTRYTVILDEEAGWRYNDADGAMVNKDDLIKVLSNLVTLKIRGEYVTGEDTGGLDNVILYVR
jgi:hypothetical protein